MHLAGQERDEAGYAMAALLTMIAVMSILLAAALPVWRHEIRREKEAELVFRGEQYVHAIGLFQRRFSTYPPNVDILVQQKFLRKKYPDPITGKDFRPIYVGQLGQEQPGQSPGSRVQPPAVRPGQPQPAGVGGLVGVASTSQDDSIRIYKGRTKYNQWEFTYAGATLRPGQPGGQGRPGLPGGREQRPGSGPGIRRPGIGPGEGGGMRRPQRPGGSGGNDQPPQGQRPFAPMRPPGGD